MADTEMSGSKYKLLAASGDLLKDLSETKARDRIQALLSNWLRIENMVVLVGAGCSVSQGGPILAELQKHVLDTLCNLGADLTSLGKSLGLVETQQKNATQDFEAWLSSIATAEHILRAPDSPFKSVSASIKGKEARLEPDELSSLLSTISRTIASRCSLSLPRFTTCGPTGHHALIAKLVARDPKLGRTHLFTVNYDLLLEQAADDLRIRYSDGFVGNIEPKFDTSAYSLDLYYPGDVSEGRVQRFDKFFHLYKLHGSINWRRDSRNEVLRADSGSLPSWSDWKNWDRECQINSLTGDAGESVAILPTENKYMQSIGMPYAHLFRAFDSHLKRPQTFLMILGYGFGDKHINRIIDEALTNPGLLILVVDPTPTPHINQSLERYQIAGNRAFLLTGRCPDVNRSPKCATFDDFAVNLLPHVRWLDEFIQLRQTEQILHSKPQNEEPDDDSSI